MSSDLSHEITRRRTFSEVKMEIYKLRTEEGCDHNLYLLDSIHLELLCCRIHFLHQLLVSLQSEIRTSLLEH